MLSGTNTIACRHAVIGLALLAGTLGGKAAAQEYSIYPSWDAMDKATDAKYATATRVSGTTGHTSTSRTSPAPPVTRPCSRTRTAKPTP